MKVNIKQYSSDLQALGFEVREIASHNQIMATKNDVKFTFNCSNNTWTCGKLKVSGKGIANLNHVAENMLIVKSASNKKDISRVFYNQGFIARFLSRSFYYKLMNELKD